MGFIREEITQYMIDDIYIYHFGLENKLKLNVGYKLHGNKLKNHMVHGPYICDISIQSCVVSFVKAGFQK